MSLPPATSQGNVLLQIENEYLKREHEILKAAQKYQRERFSAKFMNDNMIRKETGLPNKTIFNIDAGYIQNFKGK